MSARFIWLVNGLFACSWIQAVVTNLDDAHEQIDTAIATALKESKPVYLSISCNLPGLPHPTFSRDPVPFFLAPRYHLLCTQIHGLFFMQH